MNEDINIDELAELADIPEEYHGLALEESMPKLVEDWTNAVVSVSKKNDIPATTSFFVILGQITKDFVRIPRGVGCRLPVVEKAHYGISYTR